MNKIVAGILLVTILLVSAAAYAAVSILHSGGGFGHAAVKVVYLPAVQSLPLFVAMENGFFEKEGIKVDIQRMESPNNIFDMLVSGKADGTPPMAASGIAAIVESKNPGTLKVFAFNCGTISNLNDELLVARNSSIVSIRELVGKKIGIIPGIQFKTVARKVLAENNISERSVELIELPIPNQLQALAAGSVDAVLTLEPTGTIGENRNISRILVASPMVKFISNPWCGGVGIVTNKFMSERPVEAKAFMQAMNRAMEEINRSSDTKQLLVNVDVPKDLTAVTPLPVFVTTDSISQEVKDSYQRFVNIFHEFGVIEGRFNVTSILLV